MIPSKIKNYDRSWCTKLCTTTKEITQICAEKFDSFPGIGYPETYNKVLTDIIFFIENNRKDFEPPANDDDVDAYKYMYISMKRPEWYTNDDLHLINKILKFDVSWYAHWWGESVRLAWNKLQSSYKIYHMNAHKNIIDRSCIINLKKILLSLPYNKFTWLINIESINRYFYNPLMKNNKLFSIRKHLYLILFENFKAIREFTDDESIEFTSFIEDIKLSPVVETPGNDLEYLRQSYNLYRSQKTYKEQYVQIK